MKLTFAIIALLLTASAVRAATSATLHFTWDRSPAYDFAGYRFYQKTGTTPLPVAVSTWKLLGTTKLPEFTVPDLPTEIPLTFSVTAFNLSQMESGRGRELTLTCVAEVTGLNAASMTVTVKP